MLGFAAALLPAPLVTAGLAGLVVLALLLEAARLGSPAARDAIHGRFGVLFRAAEARRVSGATLLAAAYLAAWLIFPAMIAARAMLVTSFADPAAALAGPAFTGARGRKTWAGSAAAALTAFVVLAAWFTPPLAAAAAALVAAAAERVPGPGLDNVAMPLATAAALLVLA